VTTHGENAYALYEAALGESQGTGEWFLIDQARIDAFAEVTEDRQFIHVDPKMSADLSPFGVTIAHGFLTLSMLSHLCSSLPVRGDRLTGIAMGLNYGFEKVRFLNPVKVDSRIRASSVLSNVELKDPDTVQSTQTVTVEIEGETKPALVAEWTTRYIYS
jgi:acyl dehydratase